MENIPQIISEQRQYFDTGITKKIAFRKAGLLRLREVLRQEQTAILDALHQDFKKPQFEGYVTEYTLVIQELNHAIKELWKWQQPKKVKPSLFNFPSSAYHSYEPYGTTLLIAPWNYPFQLVFGPLIGAIAAGNTVVIKPSELTPNTAALISSIIAKAFPKEYITVIEGDKEVSQALLKRRWDYIFFTGSVKVGKIVAKAASEYLTPITLELGGKSPCVVHPSAKLEQAAKRIVWGKFVNAGQTCIAPDYVLVHHSKKEALIQAMQQYIQQFYGRHAEDSADYARIINEANFDRLTAMLDDEKIRILYGGARNRDTRYIAPTLVETDQISACCMTQEIFGPILPILTFETTEQLCDIITAFEKPLSAYLFSRKRRFNKWFLHNFSFGGGVINDTLVHFVNKKLQFGGVGNSGIGHYHGQHSFNTFSHTKAIVKRATWLDIPVRYAPYKNKLLWVKRFMKWI